MNKSDVVTNSNHELSLVHENLVGVVQDLEECGMIKAADDIRNVICMIEDIQCLLRS